MDFLYGIPGKLNTLLTRLSSIWAAKVDTLHDTRLTSARAGYLDKLNITGNVASATDWTPARAAKLDTVALESSPQLAPPIAAGFTTNATYSDSITDSSSVAEWVGGAQLSMSTTTSFQSLVNISGAGVLNFCVLLSTTVYTFYYKVIIDGVTLIDTSMSINKWAVIAGVFKSKNGDPLAIALDQIPFKQSLVIQVRHSAAASVSGAIKYRRTA